jgi:hypothetical protein
LFAVVTSQRLCRTLVANPMGFIVVFLLSSVSGCELSLPAQQADTIKSNECF